MRKKILDDHYLSEKCNRQAEIWGIVGYSLTQPASLMIFVTSGVQSILCVISLCIEGCAMSFSHLMVAKQRTVIQQYGGEW